MNRIFLVLLVFGMTACSRAPEILVDGETLIGEYAEDSSIAVFRGVPFAEPPVGDLRWRAPQPLASKMSRRDATQFAPACMQSMRILDWYRYTAETFGGSADYYPDLETDEDCLYLNVWTPTLQSDAKLPVMVYIHGGSNKSGWSFEPNYAGDALASRGVVVISITYRVGVFGFVSHPDLNPDEAMANFGLWDVVAALRWVQRNAASFGGDPDRVTLFAESSGAQDALALVVAEPGRDLFHRMILQSTAGYGIERMSSLSDEMSRGSELGRVMGFSDSESLAQLRKVPAGTLLQTYEATFPAYYHSPAIDGQLLDASTWSRIQSGDFHDVPMLAGTNRDEWLEYIHKNAAQEEVLQAAANLQRMDGDKALAQVQSEPDPRRAMDRLITAEAYVCPAQYTALRFSAEGPGAWLYYFTRVREDIGGSIFGAYHGAELPYVFDTHDSYMQTTDTDVALTEAIMTYWTQFAATGNPNSDHVPHWPMFSAPEQLVQELGDQVKTISAPEPELCALFNEWANNNLPDR